MTTVSSERLRELAREVGEPANSPTIADMARELLAARSAEPVGWQSGERELAVRWVAQLMAKLSTKPDHADDCLWLERLAVLFAAPAQEGVKADRAAVLEECAQAIDEQWQRHLDEGGTDELLIRRIAEAIRALAGKAQP